jgi:hypothetical protein
LIHKELRMILELPHMLGDLRYVSSETRNAGEWMDFARGEVSHSS